MIFDSHAHYDDSRFDEDREYLLGEYLPKNGVVGIMHAATDIESSRFGIATAARYDYFYTSVGIHPENMDFADEGAALEELRRLAAAPKVRAIGEIGLDYHYDGFDRERQLSLFEKQLILAGELSLPAIIHSRDATEDCLTLLRKHRPAGVMHCFSGSAETAREVLALGLYIGFTGVITFKNAKKALRALEAVPMERLLLETDCPYMAPEPFRGARSDSSMILRTAEAAARVKGVSVGEVLAVTAENARRAFAIDS